MLTDSVQPATVQALEALRRYPADVVLDIAPNDPMYGGPGPASPDEHYKSHGRVMLDAIRMAMLAAGKETPNSILDLPSGHGRVLRLLKAEYPEARLTACDIQADAVDFCAEKFGATPIYSTEHPRDIDLSEQYDLAWCGSLFTHLDKPMWDEFLEFFERAMVTGGLLVMTVAGRFISAAVKDPACPTRFNPRFDEDPAERERYLHDHETGGFGYAEYPWPAEAKAAASQPSSYGVTVVKPWWVMKLLEERGTFQIVTYTEGRWGLQDVIGLVRVERVEHPTPLRYNVPLGGLD
jgi:SAM-dependent methyltransferase